MSKDSAKPPDDKPVTIAIPVLILKTDPSDGKLKFDGAEKDQLLTLSIQLKEENEKTAEDKQFAYMLEVEDHADNFFEIKHKISFFLITAAVGSVGYTLNFAVSRLTEVVGRPERIASLVVGALCAILTVGVALFSMYYDMQAYRRNLRGYFARDTKDDEEWKRFRRRSTYCQRLAFGFLFLSIIYQAAHFILFLI
jgi:hypothetical protein